MITKLKCYLAPGVGNYFISVFLLFIINSEFCQAQNPELEIWPLKPKPVFVGESHVLTCMLRHADPNQTPTMEWLDINNRTIQQTSISAPMYVEENLADNSLSLFMPSIRDNMAGDYWCRANYANEKFIKKTRLEVFLAITWKNCPEEQYPIVGKDFKLDCIVDASPSASISWSHNGKQIISDQRYPIDSKGLVIRNVQETDDGIYTIRAAVPFTGEVKERNIKVEVHIPPKIIDDGNNTFRVVEGESAELRCKATGKPNPIISWIKQSTKENLATADRFTVNEHTGVLRINRVEQNDDSEYTCFARNKAGTVENTVKINVLVKPKIFEFLNMSIPEHKEAQLICKASGRPAPDMTFRKFSNREPYQLGIQLDDRIKLEVNQNEVKGETTAILKIRRLTRYDDGLYECIASNTGATAYKNGHLTVEFAPVFPYNATQPPVWTWDNRPGNLSCLAEAIPNATIEWYLNERRIITGPNLKIIGSGPQSNLIVTPVTHEYYTKFKCVAKNLHGESFHYIELKQAFVPNVITQADVEEITATTIRFRIIPPPTYGGLPITAFTAQYKPETEIDWRNGMNRTWSVGNAESLYIVENLKPQSTYNFRFAAHNQVGMGQWSGDQTRTMPARSSPEEPKILSNVPATIPIQSAYPDHFELRWRIPNDNGERIDTYNIRYCRVHKVNDNWEPVNLEKCHEEQFLAEEASAYELNRLTADSYYKIELKAHNAIGYSRPSEIIIKTARGKDMIIFRHEETSLSSVLIIGIVIAAVLIILVIVDISCYCVNRAGILMFVCEKVRGKPVEDDDEAKLGRDEKEPLRSEEHQIIDDNTMKRNASIEFDGRRVYTKTGEMIGKNSAV